ncbi:MAG: DNA polymerase III subunit delta [Patescibacteria group bacterium]
MLIFLYGEDSYSSRQKLGQIKEKAKKADPQSLNIAILEGEKTEFDQIKKAIETAPFLARTRLVILENTILFGKKNLKEKLAEFLKDNKIPKTSIVIFWERGTPEKKDLLFKILLKKADQSEDFVLFFGFQLNYWIKEEVKNQGGKIDQEAAGLLAAYVGSNLWQMACEIEKLILYKKNDKLSIIKKDDVEKLVVAQLDTRIFNFIDAISAKNKKRALTLLHSQLAAGESEIYLLAMITYQFRNMILVLDLMSRGANQFQISKEAKIHPYVVKKITWNINKFNILRLREIYKKLLKIDINLKRTIQSPALSLDMLVCELCK